LRREPASGPSGEIWETLQDPDRDELVAGVERAGRVLEPGRRWHYSNLAFALLGEVVARTSGDPWEVVLRQRLLQPLGMTRTTLEPVEPRAHGYFVEPYSDVARLEPLLRLRGMAPAGQLWSTPTDLARWAAFLADPDPDVLDPDSLAEARHPQVIADLQGWTLAWGLGLMLYHKGERILHGHAGGMPGFLSSVMAYDKDGEHAGVAVLANSTAGVDVEGLAADLLTTVLDARAEERSSAPSAPPTAPSRVSTGPPTPSPASPKSSAPTPDAQALRLPGRRGAGRVTSPAVASPARHAALRGSLPALAPPGRCGAGWDSPIAPGLAALAHAGCGSLGPMHMRMGVLEAVPARERPDLVSQPVAAALAVWNGPVSIDEIGVAEIDPELADTAAFCERYNVGLDESANCVVVAARRGGETRLAACVVLATTRADVNGLVRRHLAARRASFAPLDAAVAETGMEYGGITPIGLPDDWPILIDAAVAASSRVVVGSGLRRSKLTLPGKALAALPQAEVLEGLGR